MPDMISGDNKSEEKTFEVEKLPKVSKTKKVSYLSPQGHTCKMIRATENTVTLLIYDNPNDPHEWTTTIDNFCKNYKAIS